MMKKHLTMLLLLGTSSLFAQKENVQNADLEQVVIKGNRLDLPFSEQSRTLNIISRAQIQAAPVQSVAELLQYVGGVDIRQRGVNGVQADVHLRGGGFEQVLILINGVRMSDPQTGHHNLNLPIDIENIERIEILKGPGARIYGQNAFAGAINIVTKLNNEKTANVAVQAGDFGLLGARAGISLPIKNVQQYLSVAYDQAKGYRPQTDYKIANFFYQSQMGKTQKYNFMAGFTDKKMGANGWYGPEVNQRENTQTNFANLDTDIKINEKINIRPNIYWRRNQDKFWYGVYPRNFHLSQVNGIAINSNIKHSFSTTCIGIDASRTFLTSTKLSEHTRQVFNAFIEERFIFFKERIDFTPGVNYNYFSDFQANGHKGRLLWGADLGVKIASGFKAYANIGTTYRIPTYTDLYYSDPANEGNPTLLPEEALTYELGLKYLKNGWNVQLSYYNRSSKNQIDWTKSDVNAKWKSANIGKVDMAGIDFSVDAYLPTIVGEKTPIQRVNLSYNNIDAKVVSDYASGTLSKYILSNFKHQFIAGIESMPLKGISGAVYYRYNERVVAANATPLKYNVLDAKIMFQNKRYQIFMEVSNIFNEAYFETTSAVPMPERWFSAGTKIKLFPKQK
jgi:vitamin B12 transporter